ncbi:disease resistance protein RPV1-like [Helianthus annuus]|uniref:disease resistance protein RPV1-like n=1 Tax=Helianthus annuus TaxID=4232 RepID=UPI000B8FB223|nr:disease resistance protein RPV1-like [Helianthus annuus]
MAYSSTLVIHKCFTYDVFLSFRDKDTRKNFVDYLYFALQHKNFRACNDDKIKKGKMINDELIKSIKDSKFYIIIFFKNYASSSWCLDELVKIMECHRNAVQVVYPIFYDVEPFEIRKLSEVLGKAFAKHEK